MTAKAKAAKVANPASHAASGRSLSGEGPIGGTEAIDPEQNARVAIDAKITPTALIPKRFLILAVRGALYPHEPQKNQPGKTRLPLAAQVTLCYMWRRKDCFMSTELTLELLRQELRAALAPIRAELALIQARADGLPLIGRAVTALQQDARALRAAFNDFALTNVTAGEIQALHNDVDRVQSRDMEIRTRLATIERILREHSMLPPESERANP